VAPDWVQLSTRTAPKRDRFEVFRENFSQHLYRAEVENSSKEGTFEGEIELLRAGSVGISRIVASPSTYARMRRHVSDSDDALTLFVGINHGLAIEQAGICHEFRPGNGFLYHGAIPGAAEASAPINLWGIKVPADRVTSSLAPRCGLKPTSVPTELPAMQLIAQYLNSFSTVAASPDTDIREAFGSHLVDLLMLIVGADRNSLELIKGRGLKAARTEAVLRAIARHFAAPNLTADGIGLGLGITGRQVHRLLEETTKTFYEHLLERRLIEAHKLLTSPACNTLNVAEIARRAGFTDRTHFHRVFRIRFGGTPMDVRAAAAREHAKRFGVVLPT
jgi:AraC-like DNA-binding protein